MKKRDSGPILGGKVDVMRENTGDCGLRLISRPKCKLGLGLKLELGLWSVRDKDSF